ncbi:MAG: hypothetical protein WBA92_14875 [Pseudorhodobacter sp.]
MKCKIITADTATINGVSAMIGFSTLARSGDVINGVTFSQLTDLHGSPVKGERDADKAESPDETRAYVRYIGPILTIKEVRQKSTQHPGNRVSMAMFRRTHPPGRQLHQTVQRLKQQRGHRL